MKKFFILIIYAVLLNSCEVIVISGQKPVTRQTSYNRDTPVGSVYLFKMEIDSSNIYGASRYLIGKGNQKLLAVERYELYPEIARFGRIFGNLPITAIFVDTLNEYNQKVKIEFDYTKTLTFYTSKIENYWYIYELNGFHPK